MYKRILALCLVLALFSGCLFNLSDLLFRAGTTVVKVKEVELTTEEEEEDVERLFYRVDENYNRKE